MSYKLSVDGLLHDDVVDVPKWLSFSLADLCELPGIDVL